MNSQFNTHQDNDIFDHIFFNIKTLIYWVTDNLSHS